MRNLIPVLAGCLCLAAVVYAPVLPPGPDTAVVAGARQRAHVKNAHEREWRKKKREMDSLKVKYDSMLKGLVKGDLKATLAVRTSAIKAFKAIDKLYFLAQEDIEEYRTNHPQGFRQLGGLKDHHGKAVTVYIGRKELPVGEYAMTYWRYSPEYDQVYTVVEPDKIGDAFLVYIQPGEQNTGAILAHEKGHIMDIVKDPVGYWKDSAIWTTMNCQEPGACQKRYVRPACLAEDEYKRKTKDIYKRRRYSDTGLSKFVLTR